MAMVSTHVQDRRTIPDILFHERLFIIEGVFTILFAGIATFILPDWPENTRWLNEEERALAALRLVSNAVLFVQLTITDTLETRLAEESGDEVQTTAIESLKMAVTDYKFWLFVSLQILLQALSSLTNWFPSLVCYFSMLNVS